MLSFIQFILEELNPSQKQIVRGWVGEAQGRTPAKDITKHIKFNKDGRLYIPLQKSDSPQSSVLPEVEEHLKKKGFVPIDHTHAEKEEEITIPSGEKKGQVIKRKRKQTIGSLLADNPELQKQHALHGSKAGTKESNLMVVISRNPEDVAGMASGTGRIPSCKTMSDPESKDPKEIEGGSQQRYLKNDITTTGTHVAYLIHPEDTNIERPISRISLNPYVSASGKHTILRPPRDSENSSRIQQYGFGGEDFENTVKNWAEKEMPQNPDEPFYKVHDQTYDDETLNSQVKRSHHFSPNLDEKAITKIVKTASPQTLRALVDSKHPKLNEKHIKAMINRPEVDSKRAGLMHPLASEEDRNNAMNSNDHRIHEAVMMNPNATRQQLAIGLRSPVNTVKQVAANHKNVHLNDLYNAHQDPSLDEATRNLIKKRIKNKETAAKLLASRKT